MDGKIVLGLLNYSFLSLIFIFGSVSLIVKDQRKKLSFLFFMLFSAGILSYLFFAGIAFILPGIVLLFFCLAVFLMVASQEYFGFGNTDSNQGQVFIKKQEIKRTSAGVIINLFLSVAFCAGAGFIFFYYNHGFYEGLILVETFSVAGMSEIISNIGLNYIPVVLVALCALTSSFLWFLGVLEQRRDRN